MVRQQQREMCSAYCGSVQRFEYDQIEIRLDVDSTISMEPRYDFFIPHIHSVNMTFTEDTWFWYLLTEAYDGHIEGSGVREIYTITRIHSNAVEVKKEVPGLKEPEILHTMMSYGSCIFDLSKLAVMGQETIDTCLGKVKCDLLKFVGGNEEITAYVDKKNIVYRYAQQIKRADGKLHTYARELVAIGL